MSDPFISQIYLFGCSYAISDFVLANGAIVSVNQYQALYSLLGNQFGGSGQVSFGIPNLCGRAPVGWGKSNTGTIYTWSYYGGEEVTTQAPLHTHAATYTPTNVPQGVSPLSVNIAASGETANNTLDPDGNYVSQPCPANKTALMGFSTAPTDGTYLAPPVVSGHGYVEVEPSGNSNGVSNMSPYVTLTYIICTQGIYPVRP